MKIQTSEKLKSLPVYALKEINDKVEEMKKRGVKVIDFGVGDPSESTPDFVINALTQAGKKHAHSGYPSYNGSLEFRSACAHYMKRRFNVELDPETEISSNIGSKEAIFNFPQAILNPGDYAIVPSPGYPPMKNGTIFAGGKPYFMPLLQKNNWLLDYEAIPKDIAEKSKIIWINYPNSPTGATAGRAYYEGLIKWAHKHNIIIAADEGCYIDIYFGEKPLSILEIEREGVIAFYSLSKRNNMTGYRAGFVAGDREIVDAFKKLKTNIDSGTPSVMQEAAILALDDDAYAGSMRSLYAHKMEIMVDALHAAGFQISKPPATFYLWLKVPGGNDIDFAKKLIEIGIVATPGSLISDECADGSNPGKGFVRFAMVPSSDEIKDAANRIH